MLIFHQFVHNLSPANFSGENMSVPWNRLAVPRVCPSVPGLVWPAILGGVDLSNGSLNDVISSSIACLNRRLVTVNLAPWVQLPSPFMNRLV
jgi:hypothetical protein